MENPLISIVMATYNAAPYLPQCLDSICCQTYKNWELIVVDDGSTDDSHKVIDSYIQKDSRIRVLHQGNAGAGIARNLGLRFATGAYVLFLDSDDYFEPSFLAEMVASGQKTNADVTICRSTCFDDATGEELPSQWLRKDYFLCGKTQFVPEELADSLFQFTYGWAWDKLFRRELLTKHRLQFSGSTSSNDMTFVYGALVLAKRIGAIDSPLVHYRMHRQSSISGTATKQGRAETGWKELQYLENFLKKQRVYPVFEQTFLNFSMDFSVWNVSNLAPGPVQKTAFYRLKKQLHHRDVYREHPQSYYHDKQVYWKYWLIKYGTYGIFHGLLGLYRVWKQRK